MTKEGKKRPAGMELVEIAKQNGNWNKVVKRPEIDFTIPKEFENALNENPLAKEYFNALSKRHQREYLVWIIMAKRAETRKKRINESIRLLTGKQTLGLK